MNQILHDCIYEFVLLYIDDHSMFSKDLESRYKDLEMVLQRIQDNESYASTKKGGFLKKLIFFGCWLKEMALRWTLK